MLPFINDWKYPFFWTRLKIFLLHKNPKKKKEIRFGGKYREAFAIFFQLWQFVKQSVWSGVVQAPGEILEIAQGWSRQREICMSTNSPWKQQKMLTNSPSKFITKEKPCQRQKRSKIQVILPHLLNLYYRSKSFSSSERPIESIISYPCPQCDVFVSH